MPLRLIDRTLPTPEENLALDEALLRVVDDGIRDGSATEGFLRFWESPIHFVVLGVSSRLREDVALERCREDGVPVLRRASGGGTVLQGPGCLNATFVLPLERHPDLRDVKRSHRFVIGRCVDALAIPGSSKRGTSDLALGDLKFGGSAQKRTPRALLHHVSLLHDFELGLVSRYLREPERQPEYRGRRPHREFLVNAPLTAEEIRTRLASGWETVPADATCREPELESLLEARYASREWNERL